MPGRVGIGGRLVIIADSIIIGCGIDSREIVPVVYQYLLRLFQHTNIYICGRHLNLNHVLKVTVANPLCYFHGISVVFYCSPVLVVEG